MMLRSSSTKPRRGAILLVVLTLLALFAVIGLSFVLYAESEATAARIAKDALSNEGGKQPDSIQAVNGVLGQILYPNASNNSAFYGHDFARLVYGRAGNEAPYNGHGVYEELFNMPWLGMPAVGPGPKLHRTQVVNFRPFNPDPAQANFRVLIEPDLTFGGGYLDDPTRLGPLPMGRTTFAPHYVGRNAPYTYADRNNISIAVIDPATGYVIKPSYMSRDLFNSGGSYLGTPNDNWYQPAGYFKILRPRPIDQLTTAEINYLKTTRNVYPTLANPVLTNAQMNTLQTILEGRDTAANTAFPSFKNLFPFPPRNPDGDITGDVQNYKYTNNRQAFDSVWLDGDLPLVKYKGRYLKPMVAPLILPLDGRINYNAAGNLRSGGANAAPRSNQGFGPHEVNLRTVLTTSPTVQFPLTDPQALQVVYQRNGNTNDVPNPRGSGPGMKFHQFHDDPTNPTDLTVAQYPPSYAAVDFDGKADTPPSVPTTPGALFSTTMSYGAADYATQGNSSTTNRDAETTHPGTLFNPYHWTPRSISGAATANIGNPYPIADARRLTGRFSDRAVHMGQTSIGVNFSALVASLPQHPANTTRTLLTPISNRVARPGLAPNFFGPVNGAATTGTFLTLTPTGLQLATNGAAAPSTGADFDLSLGQPLVQGANGHLGGDADGSTAAIIANQRAFLQGVNINRPLADYRDPTTVPTGMTASTTAWVMDQTTITPASHLAAVSSRQALARDIFRRLCVACGAKVYVSGTTFVLPTVAGPGSYTLFTTPSGMPATPSWTVTKPEYDAIRYLAQLAANIVDYVDGDDINTPFVWNPVPPAMAGNPPSDDPTSVDYGNNFAAGALSERVVFGVEKPRLVINESLAQVTNAVADESSPSAAQDFEVRFFIELLNPGRNESIKSMLVGPDGTTPGSEPLVVGGGMAAAIPCYRLQVYDNGVQVRNELAARTPENVTGAITLTPRLQTNFVNAIQANALLKSRVEPNNGAFTSDPTPMTGGRNGFCVVGPQVPPATMGSGDPAYRPDTAPTAGNTQFLVQIPNGGGANQLMYTVPRQLPSDIAPNTLNPLRNNGHAVVLQRLACPYLPESPTNPYLTVDAMSQVWVNDAIRVGRAPAGMGMTGVRAMTPTAANNHSTARMAPYAGFQPNTPAALDPAIPPAFGTASTITQRVNPAPTATPHESFFRHNTQTTTVPTFPVVDPGIVHPFAAPTALDRRLINVAELLHVATCRSYELTTQFAAPTAGAAMTTSLNQHLQELNRTLFATGTTGGMNPDRQLPLYRLFEVLQTKPWNWGIPHGGRTPGAVNVNMLWDEDATTKRSKVFDAVMDPEACNRFTQADLDGMWANLKSSRTPNWTAALSQGTIRATTGEADDTGATGTDRPFRGFGTGVFTVSAQVREPGGMDSTLLRRLPVGMNPVRPLLATAQFSSDPWVGYEPMRKAFSQLTTTTDAYQVVMTIGYFDVVNPNGTLGSDPSFDPASRAILRREAYNTVPGDLRQQFTATIDRSNLAKPAGAPDGTTGVPWFTELVQAPIEIAPPNMTTKRFYIRFKATGGSSSGIFVNYDGGGTTLVNGSQIRVGSGPNAETFTVSTLGANLGGMPAVTILPYDADTGLGTLCFDLAQTPNPQLPRTDHIPGEAVTGPYVPGHPGSVAFDINNPAFRGVVRSFARLTP